MYISYNNIQYEQTHILYWNIIVIINYIILYDTKCYDMISCSIIPHIDVWGFCF